MTSRAETLLSRAAAQNKAVVDLAMIASPTVRIEPALLRTLRLEFLRASDPSAEADLWMSPLVSVRSASAITLVPEVASVLRQRLSEVEPDQAMFRRVADRIAELHAGLSPLLRLEEKVIRLCYEEPNPVDGIDAEIAPLVRTIHEQPDRSAVLASWAVRAIPRLPEAARRSSALWALALAGSARFGVQPLLEGDPPEGAVRLIPGLLPSDVATTSVEVRRSGATLELSLPVRNPSTLTIPSIEGGVLLEVPATNPVIVEVRDGTLSPLPVVLTPGARKHLSVTSDAVRLRTLRGETFDLHFWSRAEQAQTADSMAERAQTFDRPLSLEEMAQEINQSRSFKDVAQRAGPPEEPDLVEPSVEAPAEVVIDGRTIFEQAASPAIPSGETQPQRSAVMPEAPLEQASPPVESEGDVELGETGKKALELSELYQLREAVIDMQLSRDALLSGINTSFVMSIPLESSLAPQILVDLRTLSRAGQLMDGTWPLETWLRNAIALARQRVEVELFLRVLERFLDRNKMTGERESARVRG